MSYIKNTWVDQDVERPKTFEMTNNSDGSVTLIDSFGLVSELGTPVNADNMNHIEEGIAGCDVRKYDAMETYGMSEWVTGVVEGEKALYESLKSDNLGNPLTDETSWKKVEFNGGGSGLEVGDIGIALYVDETKGLRRRLNGSTVAINANTQGFLKFLKGLQATTSSLFTDEDTWQSEMEASDLKQIGKFVIDEEGGTIRLPKVVNLQGVQDMAQCGMTVKAGLPNIKATNSQASLPVNDPLNGAFSSPSVTSFRVITQTSGGAYVGKLNFDASRSNPTYGNSNTVQQEQIQYPYFIQVATGAEEEVNIKNEIELNNPYTLFDSKYSEAPLYNASWLLSNGSYYPKGTYVTAYEALEVEQNAAIEAGSIQQLPSGTSYVKRGLSVKLSTEEFTDYDFVLNKSNETFRLPIATNERILIDKKEPTDDDPTWYNLYSDGWCEQGGKVTSSSSTRHTVVFQKAYKNINYNVNFNRYGNSFVSDSSNVSRNTVAASSMWYNAQKNSFDFNVQTENGTKANTWQASGYTNIISADYKLCNLYFYIGETIQNANLIDAGRIMETYATKDFATRASLPSDRYIDLTLGASGSTYTAPADGWFCAASGSSWLVMQLVNDLSFAVVSPLIGGVSGGRGVLPVKKGDGVIISFSTISFIRFYYAQGSESEA